MVGVILTGLASTDEGMLKMALEAAKDLGGSEKELLLTGLCFDTSKPGPIRAGALEGLADRPAGGAMLGRALQDPTSMTLRKRAAELLGQRLGKADDKDSAATLLNDALKAAPWELATTIATSLAQHDGACTDMLALLEQGKASPALLRQKAVAASLEKRSQPLRDRAASLTKDLPPEDSRLDKVIGERANEYRAAKLDAAHGQQVFLQQCAVCHKLSGTGGNIGPNLDGVGVRGVHRLVEDILDPNRNVDPAFRQTVVETADGRTLAGVNLRTEGSLLVLNDAAGNVVSVPAAEARTQTTTRLSLMPSAFEQTLSAHDLQSVVAYLIGSMEKK